MIGGIGAASSPRAQVYRVPRARTWELYNRLTCLVTKSCLTLCNPMNYSPLPMGFSRKEF